MLKLQCVLAVMIIMSTLMGCKAFEAPPEIDLNPKLFACPTMEQASKRAEAVRYDPLWFNVRQKTVNVHFTDNFFFWQFRQTNETSIPAGICFDSVRRFEYLAFPFGSGLMGLRLGDKLQITDNGRTFEATIVFSDEASFDSPRCLVLANVHPVGPSMPGKKAENGPKAAPAQALTETSAAPNVPVSKLLCTTSKRASQVVYDFDPGQVPKKLVAITVPAKPGQSPMKYNVFIPKDVDFTATSQDLFLGLPFLPGDTLNMLRRGDEIMIEDGQLEVSATVVLDEQCKHAKHRALILAKVVPNNHKSH